MAEMSGSYDGGATGVMTGLAAETRVATSMGWREAQSVAKGDKVLTFDAGMQTVTRVSRERLWDGSGPCPRRFWPLLVPAGALGNREDMPLLPNQSVLLESDTAEELYGDPFSLVPAAALEGVNGIDRIQPRHGFEVVTLHFADEQVVFAKSGALFLCPSSRDLLDGAGEPMYSVLPLGEARLLTSTIESEIARSWKASPFAAMAAA